MNEEYRREVERYIEHFGEPLGLLQYDPDTIEELKIIVDTCIEKNQLAEVVYPELYGEREGLLI